jgi:acyl-CoA synthetase (AMP-forming)/AMP-acid ligase II
MKMSRLIPQRLLGEGLLRTAEIFPEKIAVVVEGENYSYSRLLDTSMRLAAALRARGVRRGERVAIYMDNTWPCIVSIYATLLAGGTFLLVNPQTKWQKLAFILRDSGANVLLSDAHLATQFFSALKTLDENVRLICSGKIPSLDQSPVMFKCFEEILEEFEPVPEKSGVIPNDLAALIYTSGTTGTPKGVMMTHQSMVFASWSLIEYLRLSNEDRIMLALPLSFDYGLYQLLMSVNIGATLVVERSFTFPVQVYKRMVEQKVTTFPGVPTIFSMMIESYRKNGLVFPEITTVTNTAAALLPSTIPLLKSIFPNALIYKMYGLTECKRVCYLEPELLDSNPASVGCAIPGTEVFLRAPDGTPVKTGESGILYVRGPHVMAGYLNQPELTNEMLKPGLLTGERILCSHDWFHMDEKGLLYFEGRSDDIIKTRGEKVSPIEVENSLLAIEGISEAVVLGKKDSVLGESVQAFVVLENGCQITAKTIQKKCLASLENFMVPQRIIFRVSLPKTPNGKIDRKRLMAEVLVNEE